MNKQKVEKALALLDRVIVLSGCEYGNPIESTDEVVAARDLLHEALTGSEE